MSDSLPINLEAEEHVLGAAMMSVKALEECSDIVSATDFYRGSHALIWQACVDLHAAGDAVDPILVADRLEAQGDLEKCGGHARVAELVAITPSTSNAPHYAGIVREHGVLRDLIRVADEIAGAARKREGSAQELVEQAEGLVFGLAQARHRGDFVTASEVATGMMQRLVELSEHGGDVIGLPTGFHELDRLTSGLHPGNLVIVAGRPSQGKSALAFSMATNVLRKGNPVALFTFEMSRWEVMQRLVAIDALVDMQHITTPSRLDQDGWKRVMNSGARVAQQPLFIEDSGAVTMMEVRSKARRLKLRHPDLALVVVDYIQLMGSGSSFESRQNEVSQISRALKMLAVELKLPVLALSQLSRNVEQRHDKRPILSDLRECIPDDEWVMTPSGPTRMRERPQKVVSASPAGVTAETSMYVRKAHNDVLVVRTQYGTFRATARHQVLTGSGWKQVRDLAPGRDVVASPTRIPHENRGPLPSGRFLGWMLGNGGCSGTPSLIYRSELDDLVRAEAAAFGVEVRPRRAQKSAGVIDSYLSNGRETGSTPNPLMGWLRLLGLEGKTALDKFVPPSYMGSSDETHSALLLGLWETDGTVTRRGNAKYATASEQLARDVSWLLLACGVRSTVGFYENGHAGMYEVGVSRADNPRMSTILAPSPRGRFASLSVPSPKYIDPAPAEFVELAASMLPRSRRWQRRADGSLKAISKNEMAVLVRDHPEELASVKMSPYMTHAGVGWGRIRSIEPAGSTRVADLIVPGTNTFVTNGVVVHNSGALEQDADVVMFVYRDEYYFPEEDDNKGVAEINVAKQRNGPTGMRKLAFVSKYARFGDLAPSEGPRAVHGYEG